MSNRGIKENIKPLIIQYIALHDIFWLADLCVALDYTDSDSSERMMIGNICRDLCNAGVLITSERQGNKVQYMVI